jgi:hypothetical protein
MSGRQLIEISIGDVVRMRKPHPCGGYEWEVSRTGADIGIVCLTCKRRVMLPRSRFEKRLKKVVSTSRRPPTSVDLNGSG